MQDRLIRLREKLEEQSFAGIFVSAPAEDTGKTLGANRSYLSGFSGSMGHLLITADQAFIAVDFRYYEQAEREAPRFTLFKAVGGMETWLPDLIREGRLGGKKLGFEPAGLSYAAYKTLSKALGEVPGEDRP